MSSRAARSTALRERAERWLVSRGGDRSTAPQDAALLVHELEVYEIELEMQNEELRSSQQELEKALERYTRLFDFAPLGYVVLDSSGIVREANLEAARALGRERSLLVGQRFTTFIKSEFQGFRTFLGNVLGQNDEPSNETCELTLHVLGRVDLEVRLIGSILSDGAPRALVAIEDITERKRSESASKLLAARLAGAVSSVSHAFALFDSKDCLVLCNRAYREMIGNALSGDLVGRAYQELLDAFLEGVAFPDRASRERLRMQRLARDRDPNATYEVRTRDGRFLRVTDRGTADGGFVKTIWDLTADERRARELKEARAAAESANAAKSEFLSSVSHELRTPLNAVLGFAQLLMRDKKEPLSERHQERVSRILHGGTHLLRLID
ncbi:MAG TPA: PAS-domain containing protein, partial [Polyangiaceae bacterium]|nr:PAS-domain containing protein [Polyangiaceae bacterium]